MPYAHFGNPQSLNLYSYVENNPTTFGDPDGHQDCTGQGWLQCHAPKVAQALKDAEGSMSGTINTKPPAAKPVIGPPRKLHADSNGNPSLPPPPSAPQWEYQQSTGITALKVGDLTIQPVPGGYSGHGQGLNDPESQSVGTKDDPANPGPLPQGTYTIGAWYDGSKGKPMAKLDPSPGTEMFGRDEMEWHANNDRKPAFSSSEGCIVSPLATRQAAWASGVTSLEVVP